MILEHEIPNGSKLYFGSSAKLKRDVEKVASDILYGRGFEEIVTPIFSYHQHKSIADERDLIKINDESNNSISLRADSTIDVVRIIQKRLGRNTEHKKWFYIQPVFRYPTEEQYQVGVEYIGQSELSSVLNIALEIFNKLTVKPLMQISNMQIPKIITSLYEELSLDDFKHINIEKFLSLGIDWLDKLVYLQNVEQLDELLLIAPQSIKVELQKMKDLCNKIEYKNSVLAPLYYADMLYYDELYFRVIDKNEVYASGGRYSNLDVDSVGFAIYTDALVDMISK